MTHRVPRKVRRHRKVHKHLVFAVVVTVLCVLAANFHLLFAEKCAEYVAAAVTYFVLFGGVEA